MKIPMKKIGNLYKMQVVEPVYTKRYTKIHGISDKKRGEV